MNEWIQKIFVSFLFEYNYRKYISNKFTINLKNKIIIKIVGQTVRHWDHIIRTNMTSRGVIGENFSQKVNSGGIMTDKIYAPNAFLLEKLKTFCQVSLTYGICHFYGKIF